MRPEERERQWWSEREGAKRERRMKGQICYIE
jgi:hypothetical protein